MNRSEWIDAVRALGADAAHPDEVIAAVAKTRCVASQRGGSRRWGHERTDVYTVDLDEGKAHLGVRIYEMDNHESGGEDQIEYVGLPMSSIKIKPEPVTVWYPSIPGIS